MSQKAGAPGRAQQREKSGLTNSGRRFSKLSLSEDIDWGNPFPAIPTFGPAGRYRGSAIGGQAALTRSGYEKCPAARS